MSGRSVLKLLTLEPALVTPGQIALLHFSHFMLSSQVLLNRDIGQLVRLDRSYSLVLLDKDGASAVHLLIEDNWGAGLHFTEAEGVLALGSYKGQITVAATDSSGAIIQNSGQVVAVTLTVLG